LESLRKDFSTLIRIYLTGHYGEFAAQFPDAGTEHGPQSALARSVRGFLRTVGLILPLALMGLYLWRPEIFPKLTIDAKVVTTMFIGWLLLSIDSIFGLNVVKDFLSISKGVKDLN
jgi:hypothetical protein